MQAIDFQRLYESRLRRFRVEIGGFVTNAALSADFGAIRGPEGKERMPPGRQDAAECWLKCGTLDVCDASKIFTNIELHPMRCWKPTALRTAGSAR